MFYTFATQECVYNNLYRCIVMGTIYSNGTAVKQQRRSTQSIHGRKLFNGVLFAGFERESLYSCSDKTDLTNQ